MIRFDNIGPLSGRSLALLQELGVSFDPAPPARALNKRGASVDLETVSPYRSHRLSLREEDRP